MIFSLALVAGVLAVMGAAGFFVSALTLRAGPGRPLLLLLAGLALLSVAEATGPRGARADEVLPALYRVAKLGLK